MPLTFRADRLLRLADHLETVPDEQFDMRSWKCNGAAAFVHAQTEARP
jgi:hypothetical protein